MDTLNSLISPLGTGLSVIPDTVKLVVLGGSAEAVRRLCSGVWTGIVDSFLLTAHFDDGDPPYEWVAAWLDTQPAWASSRELDITRRLNLKVPSGNDEPELESDELRDVAFQPSTGITNRVYYRGNLLYITRTRKREADGSHKATRNSIKISVLSPNNDILKRLILDARRLYEKRGRDRINIYAPDISAYREDTRWRHIDSRKIRPLDSVILPPEVKDLLVADCVDFLKSETWYAQRGIPYRRGYLLHGIPGAGKTSVVNALAGVLGLDIYNLSLSGKRMNDQTLIDILSRAPSRCIILLEDMDAAFIKDSTREHASLSQDRGKFDAPSVTLAGLLNALDGINAAEGRLFFASTNHIERLDPALLRPGRLDVHIRFVYATKWQAEMLFKRFFTNFGVDDADGSSGLNDDEVDALATQFSNAIPEGTLSVAALQGYLLSNKYRPTDGVEGVEAWIKEQTRTKRSQQEQDQEAEEEKEEEEEEEEEEKLGEAEGQVVDVNTCIIS